MPGEHQRITKIIVWIVALSMIAYFVLTPLTFLRPTPQQVVPQPEEVTPTTSPSTAAPNGADNIDIFGTGTSRSDSGQALPIDAPTSEPTQ